MKRWTPVLPIAIVCLTAAAEQEPMKQQDNRQSPHTLKQQVELNMDYLLYLPPDYEEKEAWPLMVFLHGAGERGHDVSRVRVYGPPRLIDQGRDLPFIVVSPQCPPDRWWPGMESEVTALIDHLLKTCKVDPRRVYLTGLSMGGYGTWSIACSYPRRFAAILPVCGGGRPWRAESLSNVPVWAFHGAKDPIVPLSESQQMVEALKALGAEARLTIYPDAEHDCWTQTYANPEIYTWLLSHRKEQE